MKKTLTAVVALGMAFGFAFSAYGCNKEDTPKTEQEIYSSVVDGVAGFASYTGVITLEMTESSSEDTPENKYSDSSKIFVSYDPATKNLFTKQEMTYTDKNDTEPTTSTGEMVGKLFKSGEQWYMYQKQTMKEGDAEAQTQEGTFKVTVDYVNAVSDQMLNGFVSPDEIAEYLPDAEFATIKSAYETVYSEQLTERQKTDTTAKASASVTATETEGAVEAKIATNVEFTDDGMLYKIVSDNSLTAKDGKLTKLIADSNYSASGKMDGVTVSGTKSEKSEISISYSFAQSDFDAITVDTTNATDFPGSIPSSYEDVSFTVKIGDNFTMEYDAYERIDTPAQEVFEDSARDTLGHFWHGSESYTLTWYTDAACTTAVDWTDKKATELDGKTYYGKLTVVENKAVVITKIGQVDNRSEAYKIVFGERFLHNHVSSVQVIDIDTENAENNVCEIDRDGFSEGTAILVNGTKQADTVENFAIASQGVYVIDYQNAVVNADESLFEFDF